MAREMTWDQICASPACQGRWVALHGCTYDEETGAACTGCLVDVDEDLASLCVRVQHSSLKNCAIVYCH